MDSQKQRSDQNTMSRPLFLFFQICHLLLLFAAAATHAGGGRWQFLQPSIGISAMHMQLLNNDRVVIFDRTDFGLSNISLPAGKCRNDPSDTALKVDCTAHSVEYDVISGKIRPLMVQTDVWCSSGALMQDGRLVQTGGFNDGDRRIRIFAPCDGGECDWEEVENGLAARRWYATNHILPDGRQIIVGGRKQFNYEFYPKSNAEAARTYSLPFLVQTNDKGFENNLYPFVHLVPDGNLFIFANNRAILFDYVKNAIIKTYPEVPGGDPRNYPSTGSSVLLPLKNTGANPMAAEVMVCGGAPKGSFNQATNGNFVAALNTCGRIKITDPDPQWVMETMPLARVMGDMILLPNGDVLIINGAGTGTAGWENGRDPVLSPVLYRPNNPDGSRFEIQNPTTIPRMYHSTAILLRDGSVLVGGSNPHVNYQFTGVLFPTELSLELFSPSYMDPGALRPKIVLPATQTKVTYSQKFMVRFRVGGVLDENAVAVTMVAPSFATHSFSMNQRMVALDGGKVAGLGKSTYQLEVTSPGTRNVAPSGYYLLFAVHKDIPSEGIWVHLQ